MRSTGIEENCQKVKDNVGWRAERRAGQEIDKGLDSLFNAPKKAREKKEQKKAGAKNQSSSNEKQSSGSNSNSGTLDTKSAITKEPDVAPEYIVSGRRRFYHNSPFNTHHYQRFVCYHNR